MAIESIINTKQPGLHDVDLLKTLVLTSLEEDKAENIVAIDLSGKADFARYIVIASGRSSKHVVSIADKLAERLVKEGYSGMGIEGRNQGDWVLVDVHDIIVHVFRPEIRDFYQIEKIWGMQ